MSVASQERFVAARFDALASRFKAEVAPDDFRLEALVSALPDLTGLRVLDLGCGKGRFAMRLAEAGARVVGLDSSPTMLESGHALPRVLASASRLPFASHTFDAVIAVELFEHLSPQGIDSTLADCARVLRPGGKLAVIDKSLLALNVDRPWLPAALVKRIDERRGRWMYPVGGPVREQWFRPGAFVRKLASYFDRPEAFHLISPGESGRFPFTLVPLSRLFVLWTAHASGGTHAA